MIPEGKCVNGLLWRTAGLVEKALWSRVGRAHESVEETIEVGFENKPSLYISQLSNMDSMGNDQRELKAGCQVRQ